jgi:hypothetical protein
VKIRFLGRDGQVKECKGDPESIEALADHMYKSHKAFVVTSATGRVLSGNKQEKIPRYVSSGEILETLLSTGRQIVRTKMVVLAKGEEAWNPASTKKRIKGPANLSYTRFPDGGVTVRVNRS